MRVRRWRRRAPDGEATCREVAQVLQSYLDGELHALAARRVARHLEAGRRCGLEASTYVEIKRALRKQGTLDEVMVERLQAFAEQVGSGGQPSVRRDRGRPAAGA